MAGKEKRGPAAAEAGLFRGRTWALTPDGGPEELETPAARDFRGWLDRIGARVLVLDSDEHDRIAALTSHLPQLASTALAAAIGARLRAPREISLAGPGLAGMTRLALSGYPLWRDILATNASQIDRALAAYIQELEHVRENLRSRELEREFEMAAALATRARGEMRRAARAGFATNSARPARTPPPALQGRAACGDVPPHHRRKKAWLPPASRLGYTTHEDCGRSLRPADCFVRLGTAALGARRTARSTSRSIKETRNGTKTENRRVHRFR
jgi:hypothetical protein